MQRMFPQTYDTKAGKPITFKHKKKPQSKYTYIWILFFSCVFPASSGATLVATLPPLAAIVTMLDNGIQIECILDGNSDPHHMSIRPQQFEKLKSDFLLRTTEDRQWHHLKPKQSLFVWQEKKHAWLNPAWVYQVLPTLVAALEENHIRANLASSQQQVLRIQQQLQQVLTPLKKHGVIMQHGAWQSVFKNNGVPIHLILEKGHHGHSVSPRQLQKALEIIDKYPQVWLVGDLQHDTDSLRWLKNKRPETSLLILDSIGSCDISWQVFMQKNIQRIKVLHD